MDSPIALTCSGGSYLVLKVTGCSGGRGTRGRKVLDVVDAGRRVAHMGISVGHGAVEMLMRRPGRPCDPGRRCP